MIHIGFKFYFLCFNLIIMHYHTLSYIINVIIRYQRYHTLSYQRLHIREVKLNIGSWRNHGHTYTPLSIKSRVHLTRVF